MTAATSDVVLRGDFQKIDRKAGLPFCLRNVRSLDELIQELRAEAQADPLDPRAVHQRIFVLVSAPHVPAPQLASPAAGFGAAAFLAATFAGFDAGLGVTSSLA